MCSGAGISSGGNCVESESEDEGAESEEEGMVVEVVIAITVIFRGRRGGVG